MRCGLPSRAGVVAGIPLLVRREADDERLDEAGDARHDDRQQHPERIRRVPEPVHEAGHGKAADVQQADAVDATLEVETVRADAAEQEGEGGGESLVLVLRHRVLVERKASSIVQNGVCGTRFRDPGHHRGKYAGAMRDSAGRTGPHSGGVARNRR